MNKYLSIRGRRHIIFIWKRHEGAKWDYNLPKYRKFVKINHPRKTTNHFYDSNFGTTQEFIRTQSSPLLIMKFRRDWYELIDLSSKTLRYLREREASLIVQKEKGKVLGLLWDWGREGSDPKSVELGFWEGEQRLSTATRFLLFFHINPWELAMLHFLSFL